MKPIDHASPEMIWGAKPAQERGHEVRELGAGGLERLANGVLALVAVSLFIALKTSARVDRVATSCSAIPESSPATHRPPKTARRTSSIPESNPDGMP